MPNFSELGIEPAHRVALMALSFILLGLVLELVRRDLLKERYALLWLATSVAGLIVGIFPGLIVKFALLVQFQMLTALFVVGFMFTLAIVLGFSVIISRLTERNRILAQELALLSTRLDEVDHGQASA